MARNPDPIRDSGRRRDEGFALVVAVTAVAAFAYLAFQVLAADRGDTAIVQGRAEQAQLTADADAGISLAIHGLAAEDRAQRWSIDGRSREVDFNGVKLTITVEDERGKAPLAGLNDSQTRSLFAGAGATGDRLDTLVNAFRDWQTEDNTFHPPDEPPPPPGPLIRHGPIRTVGELIGLEGMDPALLAKIAPAVTVFFEENGPFEPKTASPLAIATMSADTAENPESLENQALVAAQRTDEDIGPDDHLIGRTLTVRVVALARDGARTHRMAIVELSGDPAKPFWIRYVE